MICNTQRNETRVRSSARASRAGICSIAQLGQLLNSMQRENRGERIETWHKRLRETNVPVKEARIKERTVQGVITFDNEWKHHLKIIQIQSTGA